MRSPKAPTPGGGRAVLAAAAKSLKEKRQASDSESETESEDSETDEEVEEENDVWRPVKLGDGRLFFFNVTQGAVSMEGSPGICGARYSRVQWFWRYFDVCGA